MSTDGFSVDLDYLDNIVAQLSGLAGFLTDHLAALDQNTAAVHAPGGWQGAAAIAHETAHSQWAAAASEFVKGVTDMSTAARNAHTQYIAGITANTRMLRPR